MNPIKIDPRVSLGRTPVQILKIQNPDTSAVAGFSAYRTDRLEEWWLVPENLLGWSEDNVLACGCRDLKQLTDKLKSDEDYQVRLRTIQTHICRATLPECTVSDLSWHITTRLIAPQQVVISIVCGAKAAFLAYFNKEKVHST